jgi:hypothetical protein
MNYTIDYYFDLQSIDNENVVDILKNIIDSNNISDEPLDYQFEILDNETQEIIFKGGEATNTIPYRYFEEVADYLTNRKREVEEKRNNFLDSIFKPTKPKEEEVVVENPPTDISEPTNDEIPASTDEEYVSPSMDSIFQEPSPPMDTQVQPEVPVMDAPVQPEVPVMDAPVQQQQVPIMDAPVQQQQAPIMGTQIQQQVPIMDVPVQPEVPIMDAPVQQQQAPIMDVPVQQQQQAPIMDVPVQQQQQAPIMGTQIQQQQAAIVDAPVQQQQQAPIMGTQIQQQQVPIMNNQMYQGGNVKSSIITVRIIIQKMKSLPFLFLKKMRYNPTNHFI